MEKVRRTMADWNMLAAGGAVLVGVSGGPDSVALLHVLYRMAGDLDFRIGIAHFHHHIRGRDADADARFSEKLAQKLRIAFYYGENTKNQIRQTRRSPEERLREARYGFLQRMARNHGFDHIALGHHADDNAEQILLNLLRGSGPLGISGIPPVRENIIRPLIRVSRDEILSYLKVYRLDYRLDPTNTDRLFLRNRVRHELMPVLKAEYNPNLTETLCRLGSVLKADNDWLDRLVKPIWQRVLVLEEPGRIVLSVSELNRQHPAARRRIIRLAVWRLKRDLRKIRYSHVDAVMALLQARHPGRLDLPDRIRVLCRPGELVFEKCAGSLRIVEGSDAPIRQIDFTYRFSENDITGRPIYIKELNRFLTLARIDGRLTTDPAGESPRVAFFDWDRLAFPLNLRNHQPGDRFVPLGLGGSQKLSDFFINHKIGRRRRSAIPVLVSGDEIIWVVGHRIADSVKITGATALLLRAEISGPDI